MDMKEKRFKIFMILVCSLIFACQIYYLISIFVSYLDMKESLVLDNLKYIYEAHPNLIISRIIVSFMKTQNLFVNFLSGVMVVFLFLGALNIIDVIYFGLVLLVLYHSIQTKNIAYKYIAISSIFRIVLFIVFVVGGGLTVLSVFTVGNISVSQAVELGVSIIPIYLIFMLLSSLTIPYILVKLEFRKA